MSNPSYHLNSVTFISLSCWVFRHGILGSEYSRCFFRCGRDMVVALLWYTDCIAVIAKYKACIPVYAKALQKLRLWISWWITTSSFSREKNYLTRVMRCRARKTLKRSIYAKGSVIRFLSYEFWIRVVKISFSARLTRIKLMSSMLLQCQR